MKSLEQQLRDAVKDIKDKIQATTETAATILAESLVEQSTVDTGLFAANWQPAIDAVRYDDLKHEDFGVSREPFAYPNPRLISEETAKEIATDIPEFKLGQEIIWSNSVPYVKSNKTTFDGEADAYMGKAAAIDRANLELNK